MEELTVGVLRSWARVALTELRRARSEIDELNVYPVPDGDTGTNLYLTWEAACDALPDSELTFAEAVQAFGRGALLGARGNSGVITSQLVRACGLRLAENLPQEQEASTGSFLADPRMSEAAAFADALAFAADAAYGAVAQPVEGTMLTVAREAANAALATANDGRTLAEVCLAAVAGARLALTRTTEQLDVLRRAGVVDAGGAGLVVILGAMESVLSGRPPAETTGVPRRLIRPAVPAGTGGENGSRDPNGQGTPSDIGADGGADARTGDLGAGRTGDVGADGRTGDVGADGRTRDLDADGRTSAGGADARTGDLDADGRTGDVGADGRTGDLGVDGPAYEVMYLLDAPDERIGDFRRALAGLGDSVVVVGGDELWNVHVHTDDVGAAIEQGIAVGRPHRIRVTHFADMAPHAPIASRAVIAVAAGDGLAKLFVEAGAVVVKGGPGRRCSTGELLTAIEQSGAPEIVILPNDKDTIAVAEAAATAARQDGIRVAVIRTRAQVQGLAAIAVHDAELSFDDAVVQLSAAAGQTRHGAVTIAVKDAWTMAGTCRIGDALGVVDGDFALITEDLVAAATGVADRLLGGGGELMTVVRGENADPGLVDALVRHVRRNRKDVDVVVYDGGQERYPLLIGVE